MRTRFALLLLALFLAAGTGAPSLPAQAGGAPTLPERQWVVREVIFPQPLGRNDYSTWSTGWPMGDIGRDGMSDFIINGEDFARPNLRRDNRIAVSLGASVNLTGYLFVPPKWTPPFSYIWGDPHVALVHRPGGPAMMVLAALCLGCGEQPVLLDLRTGEILGVVPLPPPPGGGVPQMRSFTGIWWAGDLNADGCDDLFYQGADSGYAYSGRIDGRTLQVVWQRYVNQLEVFSPVSYDSPAPPPDLNGDGVADFVSEWCLYIVPGSLPFEQAYFAYSGADGTLLWERRFVADTWYRHSIVGRDISGDGVGDVVGVSQGTDTVVALDGRSGATIWEVSNRMLDSILPPTVDRYFFIHPTFFTGVPGDPTATDIVMIASGWYQVTYEYFWGIAHIDPADGHLISYEEFPFDLQPWSSDLVGVRPYGNAHHMLLGDIDRDGFTEIGRLVVAPDFGVHGYQSRSFVVIGQQTLFAPETARIGSAINATLSIPAAAGMPFTLLASDQFNPGSGWLADGWRTHLVDGNVLQYTRNQRPAAGTLDASGEATVTLTLPSDPRYVGRTLYLRAVVTEPGSPQRVFTLSTLGRIQVTS